jgi:hypothetical protein
MNTKTLPSQMMGLILGLLLAVACGTPQTTAPKIEAKEWNLVVLGDSTSMGFGQYYAAAIEADMGVKVTLNDLWRGGLTTEQLLDDLRTFDVYRKAVKDAEVITVIANPADHIGWAIVGEGDQYDCSPKALAGYKVDLDAIVKEIFALRKGKPTLIRTYDFYNPVYSEWKKMGKYEEYKRCWEAISTTIHEAAAAHKIPIAEVYAAFNGPNHDEDAMDKGYIQADGEHPSEAGAKVIAEAFRKLGYVPIVP